MKSHGEHELENFQTHCTNNKTSPCGRVCSYSCAVLPNSQNFQRSSLNVVQPRLSLKQEILEGSNVTTKLKSMRGDLVVPPFLMSDSFLYCPSEKTTGLIWLVARSQMSNAQSQRMCPRAQLKLRPSGNGPAGQTWLG